MLVKAATLYYLEGKSQAEVAQEIGVSRSNVSRVLADARKNGIVEIRINDPFGRAQDLEAQLISRYGLRECRVAPSTGSDNQLSRVGALGAQWLIDNLPRDGGVALSWGSSVQAVVDEIPDDASHENIEVLPLVGGLSIVDSARDGNVLVRLLATKLGAQHRRLYAPAVVESLESREAFLREPSITSVLNASRRAKIAIVGVGNVGKGASSAIIESMNLSRTERSEFAASGAVGDCCTRFFDHEGKLVESVVNDRVIAIDLDELGSIPTVVGVAAGAHKLEGTHAALTGGLFDVLVVDSDLALALLNQR
ncbi:MAG: sugar-binding transcriptional regulator [Actinomycetales bacterium]